MGLMVSTIVVLTGLTLLSYPIVRKTGVKGFYFGAAALAVSFIFFLTQIPTVLNGTVLTEYFNWVPQLNLAVGFRLDPLSLAFALLVTGAGALVMLYSRWYLTDDRTVARFNIVFLSFAVSMLGLVLADDLYLLFVFWEATTVFSFLLIGHQSSQRTARAAALQALIVTTFGGLAMLVGIVLLSVSTGTSSLSQILADPPAIEPIITVAIYAMLLGALSKSAIFPFHFWLPGAMAAPTPVSAYLHAAAMVKAGIYIIARLGPAFGDVPGYRITLVTLGAITMLLGGIRALRQFDLKLLVAHGTVSQLGMLVMVFGLAHPATDFAGYALLFAHAISKAPLFLTIGIIDHRTGTRDFRNLSGLGRQAPLLFAAALLAALSMAGVPIFAGFVAKESALAELMSVASQFPIAYGALVVMILGSVLTVAYMTRYIRGAFSTKPDLAECRIAKPQTRKILIAPYVFAILGLVGGIFASTFNSWADLLVQPSTPTPEPLGIWHGFTPILLISFMIITVGVFLGLTNMKSKDTIPHLPERFTASRGYWRLTLWLDKAAVKLTSVTQRGSLPFYLATILLVFVATLAVLLAIPGTWPDEFTLMSSPVQLPIAIIMILAAIRAAQSSTRFKAVVLVGVTGYGMVAIFALHGAPDLALTQALVETVTLIAFILVIRRLPINIGAKSRPRIKIGRAILASVVAVGLGLVALVSLSARVADPISLNFAELASSGGHGSNIVNVILVDIRGWDTMGELSVVLAAATGVASLVFLSTRGDNLPKMSRRTARTNVRQHLLRVADPDDDTQQTQWLLSGFTLDPDRRSIILEVVVRLLFHALIIVSVYLLLTGHNTPGGGFAAGLVAGLALVARYLAGGRHELGATMPLDAGRILGLGLGLATTTAIVPLFFGQAALSSSWFDLDLGVFGEISFVTSTVFDIGVYFVVVGLMLDVLRSLGAEIDEHEEEEIESQRLEDQRDEVTSS